MTSRKEEFGCPFCYKVFRGQFELKEHLLKCCKDEEYKRKRYGCDSCAYRTDRQSDLARHNCKRKRALSSESKDEAQPRFKIPSVVATVNPKGAAKGVSRDDDAESISSDSEWDQQDPGSLSSLIGKESEGPMIRKATNPAPVHTPKPRVEHQPTAQILAKRLSSEAPKAPSPAVTSNKFDPKSQAVKPTAVKNAKTVRPPSMEQRETVKPPSRGPERSSTSQEFPRRENFIEGKVQRYRERREEWETNGTKVTQISKWWWMEDKTDDL